MRKKVWVYSPKKIKPQLSENKKAEIFAECQKFIDSDLLPYLAKNFNKNHSGFFTISNELYLCIKFMKI